MSWRDRATRVVVVTEKPSAGSRNLARAAKRRAERPYRHIPVEDFVDGVCVAEWDDER